MTNNYIFTNLESSNRANNKSRLPRQSDRQNLVVLIKVYINLGFNNCGIIIVSMLHVSSVSKCSGVVNLTLVISDRESFLIFKIDLGFHIRNFFFVMVRVVLGLQSIFVRGYAKMAKPKVFFDITIGGNPAGRIVMEV